MDLDKCYKHISNTDVAFVPYSKELQENTVRYTGHWWNIAGTEPFLIDTKMDVISVKYEDIPKWEVYGRKS